MRKKVVTTLVAVITAASLVSGCGRTEEPAEESSAAVSEQTENETEGEDMQTETIDAAAENADAILISPVFRKQRAGIPTRAL